MVGSSMVGVLLGSLLHAFWKSPLGSLVTEHLSTGICPRRGGDGLPQGCSLPDTSGRFLQVSTAPERTQKLGGAERSQEKAGLRSQGLAPAASQGSQQAEEVAQGTENTCCI